MKQTLPLNRASSTSALAADEAERLAELEPIIERGLAGFVEVGTALLEISDRRLYRATHSTFSDYVRDKWKMTARRAYQLCEGAEVIKSLPETVNNCSQIMNEGQARELAKAPKEKRAKVVELAATNGKLTAKSIKAAISVVEPRSDDHECGPDLVVEKMKEAVRILKDIARDPATCAGLPPEALQQVMALAQEAINFARAISIDSLTAIGGLTEQAEVER